MTRHIETHNHARHSEQLPVLAAMAEPVEDVHFGDDGVPEALSILLRQMIGEMDVPMRRDKLILFAAIRQGGMPMIEDPAAALRADHAGHDREVAESRRLAGNLSLPDGARGSWTAPCRGLAESTADLTEHVRLGNDVLFPQFEPKHA